jgi:hypothetical protein
LLQKLSSEILECYRHADECRQRAKEALTDGARQDFLDMEQRWLSLAHSLNCRTAVEFCRALPQPPQAETQIGRLSGPRQIFAPRFHLARRLLKRDAHIERHLEVVRAVAAACRSLRKLAMRAAIRSTRLAKLERGQPHVRHSSLMEFAFGPPVWVVPHFEILPAASTRCSARLANSFCVSNRDRCAADASGSLRRRRRAVKTADPERALLT